MRDFSSAIKDFSIEHARHLQAIPLIGGCREEIVSFVEHAKDNFKAEGKLRHVSKQVHCVYALQTLDEMTRVAQASLVSHSFTAAEALSRIILEQAVNFIYILSDEGVSRLRALLKHYVEDSKRRASNWAKSSSQLMDQRGVDRAVEKLKYLDAVRRENDGWYKGATGWPEARRRFFEIGCEHQYHLLFASASDSVHSLAEDMFNLVVWEGYPAHIKPPALAAMKIEKASFAIYLVINAFVFYGNAALNFASEIGDTRAVEGVRGVIDRLGAMITEHDDLTAEMLQGLGGGLAEQG